MVFSGVSLVYPSTGRMALRNVCFTVDAGQRLGVCGRTGVKACAFTTLVACVCGVDHGVDQGLARAAWWPP